MILLRPNRMQKKGNEIGEEEQDDEEEEEEVRLMPLLSPPPPLSPARRLTGQ